MVVSAGICPYDGGVGTKDNPCRIATAEQLEVLAGTVADYKSHFVLIDNIDLSGEVYSSALIAPDINSEQSFFQGNSFTGSFDGNGHILSGLTLNSTTGYLGLFGTVGCNGLISNLKLLDVNITGTTASSYAGAVAGILQMGKIVNCSVSGYISGNSNVGGLVGKTLYGYITASTSDINIECSGSYIGGIVGYQTGKISQSNASGNITGNRYIGGLCGYILNFSDYSILDCYSNVNIQGIDYFGGVCGQNRGVVLNCYSTGTLSGSPEDDWIGAVCGQNYNGTITNCFWDTQTTGTTVGYHQYYFYPGTITNVSGKTTVLMQTLSTYTYRSWDFLGESTNGENEIWRMCADGVDYPRLSWEFAANGDFACGDGTDILDLQALAENWLTAADATPATFNYACDANGDEKIDFEDFGVLGENWLLQ
jgi:hypothetical protein